MTTVGKGAAWSDDDVGTSGSRPLFGSDGKSFLGLPSNFWFWTILVAGFIVMQLVHNDIQEDSYAGLASLGVVIIGGVLLRFLAGMNVLEAVRVRWRKAIIFLLIYFALGVTYVGARWTVQMYKWSSAYSDALTVFRKEKNITTETIPDGMLGEWQSRYIANPKVGAWPDPRSEAVQVESRRWVVAWPWSSLQWALGDLLNTLVDWIMNFVQKMEIAITDYFTANLPGLKR